MFGDQRLPAGEYSLFIDLQRSGWTLILSRHTAQERYDPKEKEAIWGAYGYRQELDVLRVEMNLETLEHAVDQLTFAFLDMSDSGGKLALWWDRQLATADFALAPPSGSAFQ